MNVEEIVNNTICELCGDDYGDIAGECFAFGICPDCRDVDCMEEILNEILTEGLNNE